MPREKRSFSTFIPSTLASMISPFLNNSDGCLTFLVQCRSEICTRPSIPSSIPTNMPKSVTFRPGVPRIRRQLFHAQGNALFLAVELEHDDFDFFADSDDLRRVIDAPPGHVADVENAVDAAEIDEGAIAGNVLHCAFEDHALL